VRASADERRIAGQPFAVEKSVSLRPARHRAPLIANPAERRPRRVPAESSPAESAPTLDGEAREV